VAAGALGKQTARRKKKRRKFRFPIYVCYTYVCVYNGKIFHRICTKMKKCSHSEMVWEMVDGIVGGKWVGIMMMEKKKQKKADRSRKMKLSAYGNETQIFCVCVRA